MFGWFMAGGVSMLPVLVVGAMAVVAALRHAAVPGRGWARAAATLRAGALSFGVAGVGLDLAAVGAYVSSLGEPELAHATQIAVVGLGEALGPLALAGMLAGLSALVASAGDLRDAVPPRGSHLA